MAVSCASCVATALLQLAQHMSRLACVTYMADERFIAINSRARELGPHEVTKDDIVWVRKTQFTSIRAENLRAFHQPHDRDTWVVDFEAMPATTLLPIEMGITDLRNKTKRLHTAIRYPECPTATAMARASMEAGTNSRFFEAQARRYLVRRYNGHQLSGLTTKVI